MEQSDADTRPPTAAKMDRIPFNVERQVVQATHAGRHRQGELRTGAEAGMGRNNVEYIHGIAIIKRETLRHLFDVTQDALAFLPSYLIFRRVAERDSRAQIGDGKADAAETAAKPAVQVEETEM